MEMNHSAEELTFMRTQKFHEKMFKKYGYTNKELAITMNAFKNYIETGLKIDFDNWLDLHNADTIEKYIDYYQTH